MPIVAPYPKLTNSTAVLFGSGAKKTSPFPTLLFPSKMRDHKLWPRTRRFAFSRFEETLDGVFRGSRYCLTECLSSHLAQRDQAELGAICSLRMGFYFRTASFTRSASSSSVRS